MNQLQTDPRTLMPNPDNFKWGPPERGQKWAQAFYKWLVPWLKNAQVAQNTAVQGVGPPIVGATAITVTSSIHHITGGGTINTINVAQQNFSGPIWLIADANFTVTGGGNIARGATVLAGQALGLIFDNQTAKWYPAT